MDSRLALLLLVSIALGVTVWYVQTHEPQGAPSRPPRGMSPPTASAAGGAPASKAPGAAARAGAWWCGSGDNFSRTATWVRAPATFAVGSPTDFPAFQAEGACGADVYRQAKQDLESFSLFGRRLPFASLMAWCVSLLKSNPFAGLSGKQLPYANAFENEPGFTVVLSHHQLAFCVVNVLFGNTVEGFEWNGLSARFGLAACCPVPTYPQAVLAFLASIAASPDEGRSTYIGYSIPKDFKPDITTPKTQRMAAIEVVDLSQESFKGTRGMMSGLPFVSVTDVAGNHIGGGAALCAIADSQDESLVQFYSDTLFLSFFAAFPRPAEGPLAPPMLPAYPVSSVFGVRRYLNYLSGHNDGGPCGRILDPFWNAGLPGLSSAISVPVSSSAGREEVRMFPQVFVAVTSQGGIPDCKPQFQPLCTSNQSAAQRQPQMLTDNVQVLYAAYEPTNYSLLAEAMPILVKKVGISKFGSGLWFGDSNLFFLVDWIAVSLCSGYDPPTLNYFFYGPHWCENGPNDCYLLPSEECVRCIPPGQTAAYLTSACGSTGYTDIITRFQESSPAQVLDAVNKALESPATQQIFDILLAA